jgi:hypothetical protein
MMRTLYALLLTGLLAFAAQAHDDHGKPQWGGVVADAGPYQVELVAARNGEIKLYLTDHGAQLPSQGGSGRLTVLVGGKKEELALKPVSDSALGATSTLRPGRGARAVAVIELPGHKPATLRFVLK